MKRSPVKLKTFLPDKNEKSTDILMNDTVKEMQSVDFVVKNLVRQEVDIAKLTSIMPEQLDNLKAEVVDLQKSCKIRTNSDNPFSTREGLLLDPSGSIKI